MKELDTNKMDYLEEINKFLERNNLPRLKALGPRWITDELYQRFKEKVTPTLYNLFQRIEAEGIL